MALGFGNIFAGNPLDRRSEARGDGLAWIGDPAALAVILWQGQPLIEDTGGAPRIAYLAATRAFDFCAGPDQSLFLGLWNDTPVFAVEIDQPDNPCAGPLLGLGEFHGLRELAAVLPDVETAICGTAKALVEWRARHRYCGTCGSATGAADMGWKRVCEGCGAQHFPRTDPVAIMLPVRGDACLLGRQKSWPRGRYSALAGFVEPGESIEEACARELKEEAGLTAVSVRYHSSQPWPFPSNLMVGLIAEVNDDEVPPTTDELEAVIWVSRDEARQMLADTHPNYNAPSRIAIARTLLEAWAAEGQPR